MKEVVRVEFFEDPDFERQMNLIIQEKLTEVYQSGKGLPVAQVTTLLEQAGITDAPELADAISKGIFPKVGA